MKNMKNMKKIDVDVLDVLKKGTVKGNSYYLPNVQLDRDIYTKVNDVLKNLGCKWDRKTKSHICQEDITKSFDNTVDSGITIDEKQLYQFFETPKALVRRMVELLEIRDGELLMDVLEPSAGHGAIADEIDQSKCLFRCCEIDPKKCKILDEKGIPTICGDFLTHPNYQKDGETFDRIIMNPPFTKQQDIDHVSHAYSILRKGGKLVAIMSPGFTFRTNKKSVEFKKLVDANGWFADLPADTFKESGTSVNTVIVVLDK